MRKSKYRLYAVPAGMMGLAALLMTAGCHQSDKDGKRPTSAIPAALAVKGEVKRAAEPAVKVELKQAPGPKTPVASAKKAVPPAKKDAPYTPPTGPASASVAKAEFPVDIDVATLEILKEMAYTR